MKRVLIVVVALVVILLGAQGVGYLVALNSDAYAAASDFVSRDPGISNQIGHVNSVTLAPLDAEIRFTSDTGQAKFVVSAKTANGIHKVVVRLEKLASGWRVVDSNITS